MRALVLFLFSLMLLSCAFATDCQITITTVDKALYFDYTITTKEDSVRIPFFEPEKMIYFNSNADIITDVNNGIAYITFDSNEELKVISVKYRSTDLIKNDLYLEKTILLENFFDNTKIIYLFEEGKSVNKLMPEPTLKESKAEWLFEKDQPIMIYLKFDDKVPDLKTIVALFVLLVIVIGLVLSIFLKKRKNDKFDENIPKKMLLTENEQSIIDLLKKQDGLMQQTIAEQLELEKAHVSKLITKLERKELIERKQVGKVKKIFLKV